MTAGANPNDDPKLITMAKMLTDATLIIGNREGLTLSETRSAAAIALMEIASRELGPVGAVEYLRWLADTLEADNVAQVTH